MIPTMNVYPTSEAAAAVFRKAFGAAMADRTFADTLSGRDFSLHILEPGTEFSARQSLP